METHTEHARESLVWPAWTDGIGVLVALLGLFWYPIWLGIIGGVLGIIGLSGARATTNKAWGWIATILGAIVLILGIGGWTFAG